LAEKAKIAGFGGETAKLGLSEYCSRLLKDRSFQHPDINSETLLVEACARYGEYFRWAKARVTREEPPAAA